MLWKLIRAEQMKLKRSPVWIAFLFMPIVPAVLGTLNYLNNLELLQSEWYSLWTQHTLFTCYFFLPIMIGVYCSYSMRQEYQNHNWNKVLTMPASRSMIFLAKLILVSLVILLSEAWIGVLFVLSGKLIGVQAVVPVKEITIWCLFGTLGGMVMASIQLMISLFMKSFALPVGISLAGGISGLVFFGQRFGAHLAVFPHGIWYEFQLAAANAGKRLCAVCGYLCGIYHGVYTTEQLDIDQTRQITCRQRKKKENWWCNPLGLHLFFCRHIDKQKTGKYNGTIVRRLAAQKIERQKVKKWFTFYWWKTTPA